MILIQVWEKIAQLGIRVHVKEDKIVLEGDGDRLSSELLDAFREHKKSILAALAQRPPKASGAPYDDELVSAGSPYEGLTFGQVRTRVATAAMAAGLGHEGLNNLVCRVTGRSSLWALGPQDLHRIEEAIHAQSGEKGGSHDA